jgi:DNA-binding NtrC family response regulator
MTEMNGVELLVRIQQLKLGVPVVVISGGGVRSSAEVLNAAATRGAAAVLDKPFTLDELRETIEPILTRRV